MGHAGAALVLVAAALLLVFLAENARIPVDDPNTHLELTMIHEVMVLDHGGPDFAFIHVRRGAQALGARRAARGRAAAGAHRAARGSTRRWRLAGMFALARLVGMVESIMARLRLLRVPQLLVGAGACSDLALVLVLR